jgi:hypothetical protein
MPPYGNSPNPRAAKNAHLDAPRPITAMEIVTLAATPLALGSLT